LPNGSLAVLYEAVGEESRRIEMRRAANVSGELWSEPVVVADNAVYPRLERRGERATLAYTRRGTEGTEVVIREISGYSSI
jgi:hypothetical protein